jgi:glycosyltransferase involved in cell wall biosynthesis
MARINFVVPQLDSTRFSGGIWCILEYARGLTERGHQVTLTPLLPSPDPAWFPHPYGRVAAAPRAGNGGQRGGGLKGRVKERVQAAAHRIVLRRPNALHIGMSTAAQAQYVREAAPAADVTVATSWQTATPVAMFGSGKRAYFMQHFEPLFAIDYADPEWVDRAARLTYRMGLQMIANSSWLRRQVEEEVPGVRVELCANSIDHAVFHGSPREFPDTGELRLISYGGRQARWKGLLEMAQAVRIARAALPHIDLRWQVYGDALLPPDNEIAPYEALGFLQPDALAEAYRSADVLLSASWYESFPLFPLEAMACGLPVITTQPGTEEYAIPSETAEVVRPRDPEDIAQGIIRLARDGEYRRRVARAGQAASRNFSWDRSVGRFEELLLG